jgi:hypothetical protein
LAIAVAISSVNWPIRGSVSGGSGASRVSASIAPHNRPSTMIGVPTAARIPSCRARSANALGPLV